MKVLIYDMRTNGHHLEYLHNLYEVCKRRVNNEFIFAIPEVDLSKSEYDWTPSVNISFYFIKHSDISRIKGGKLRRCISESLMVKRIAKSLQIDEIILIEIAGVIPILPIILPNSIKIKGIIYQIYLRREYNNKISSIIEKIRYALAVRNKSTEKIYILNDKKSTNELNKIFNTNKFVLIPDPLPEVKVGIDDNNEYLNVSSIPQNNLVFLHFGAMGYRKGTIDILRAIPLIPEEIRCTFIFAGKIDDDAIKEFTALYEIARKRHNVIVIDKFCSYSFIYTILRRSDCMLVPYHNVSQSSGLIGHASKNRIPVIGPSVGLLGELIREHKLGICIDEISPESIAKAVMEFKPYKTDGKYASINTSADFQRIIMS